MASFRTVHGGRAGPAAVGILVPPGNRTVVVVRPRSLNVDLVLVRRDADGFFEASRSAAGLEAQRITQALVQGDPGRVAVAPAADGGFHVQAEIGAFSLIACLRRPGQAYRPHAFASQDEAQQTAEAMQGVLCPPADANQELYTNMSQFEKTAR